MITGLVKFANRLDRLGLSKEADAIDSFVRKLIISGEITKLAQSKSPEELEKEIAGLNRRLLELKNSKSQPSYSNLSVEEKEALDKQIGGIESEISTKEFLVLDTRLLELKNSKSQPSYSGLSEEEKEALDVKIKETESARLLLMDPEREWDVSKVEPPKPRPITAPPKRKTTRRVTKKGAIF